MSHFTMMIATVLPASRAKHRQKMSATPLADVVNPKIEEAMAPFHEFECTGRNDKYVVDIDQTEEIRKEFETATTHRLKSPDGKLHEPYADEFYRAPNDEEKAILGIENGKRSMLGSFGGGGTRADGTSISYRTTYDANHNQIVTVKFIPEGYEEVEVKRSEIETFAEYVEEYHGKKLVPFGTKPVTSVSGGRDDEKAIHKYGYALLDADGNVTKIVDRTNPNKKWDWFVLGGRWGGFFTLKEETAERYPPAQVSDDDGTLGGMFRKKSVRGKADMARKGDIDFEAMRNARAQKAAEEFDAYADVFEAFKGQDIPSWDEIRDSTQDFEAARKAHNEHPYIVALNKRASEKRDWIMGDMRKHFHNGDRAAFIKAARDHAVRTFGFVDVNGTWNEKGRMGWFATVSDEKDPDAFLKTFNAWLDGLDDDVILSVVDCHI